MNFAKAFMNKTFDIEGNMFEAISLKNDLYKIRRYLIKIS